jgi:pyruvate dehydrogenase E2 component (dihydrolipoamide acetyltransferase)
MQKEQIPSINTIFEARKKFIPEVGKQLEQNQKIEVDVNEENISVDYRVITIEQLENKNGDPVLLLPGFGSGWEGIAELGFSLACEGRRVILPSLPGYGNSENPSSKYYNTDNFDNEAEVVAQIIDKLDFDGKKVHLIGHSMGSEILATVAQKYPDKVSSLTLLNPAGVEDEDAFKLSTKFITSGIKTSSEFFVRDILSGEKDYERDLYKYISKPKSPFEGQRLKQRLAEAKKVSKGHLLEKISQVSNPITYISGELDTVYPPGNEDDDNAQLSKIIKAVNNEDNIEKSVMAKLQHNTTLAPDEITAANIEHYLTVAERKNEG